ncbi:MAG: UDP-N-acetylmuramate--L-alanine ligase [Phycisphaeraceae bacterium]
MSGLARLARHLGARCSGSDLNETETVRLLQADGVPVVLEQSAETLPQDCELVVVSAAIKPDHPEMAAALRRGVQVKKYAELLGELMIGRTGVAIAGTHGKSTTTSLLSHILIRSGLDPSFIVGANCRQIGGGVRIGNSNILVAEACEYDRSFHNFHPTHAVILNVEADHLDIYRSLDEIVEAFKVFAGLLPSKDAGGSLLINHEMPHRLAITAELSCAVETLGFAPQADWRVGIEGGRVRLCRGDDAVIDWVCPMPGEHMAYNAAAAAISAHRLGADWADIAQAIESFDGLDRRMQWLGCKSSEGLADRNTPRDQVVTVVDDYGHHPTEIDTTLRALRHHYQPKRLICVFQPHQHSRTRFLMDEFAVSFSCADIVIVPHIYFVRDSEKERQAVTAGDLVDRLRGKGVQAMHLYPFDAIVEQLNMMTQPGDLVVTMGAGDVWQVAHAYLHADKTKDVR